MSKVITSENDQGRAAYIVVYDLQGTPLSKQFLSDLQLTLEDFLEMRSEGATKAITVSVE